jgi:hypothetical protein
MLTSKSKQIAYCKSTTAMSLDITFPHVTRCMYDCPVRNIKRCNLYLPMRGVITLHAHKHTVPGRAPTRAFPDMGRSSQHKCLALLLNNIKCPSIKTQSDMLRVNAAESALHILHDFYKLFSFIFPDRKRLYLCRKLIRQIEVLTSCSLQACAHDLALGCVYGVAHRELHTCALSFFSHTHVRTASRRTLYARRERSTLLQHLPITPHSKHSRECAAVGRVCVWYILLRYALE